jgi:homoserine kinase type II
MSAGSLDAAARDVLRRYPSALQPTALIALGNHGGFSGARLWRVESAAGSLCLRAWPPGDPTPRRLDFLHRFMTSARTAGLAFVPTVFLTTDRSSWVDQVGRLWELTQWLPGQADFHDCPTTTRLEASCTGLARLHVCWQRLGPPPTDDCPAIARRLERAFQTCELIRSGWRPTYLPGDPVRPHAERVWPMLRPRLDALIPRLEQWSARRWPLQPCLCDVWHNHVLFEGDRLTGLIDYGSAKVDHVAVDLARLLGSLVGDDGNNWAIALRAYRTVRPLAAQEEDLAHFLDETGTVLGVANWLRWLCHGERQIEDRSAAAERLRVLVERMDR